MLRRDGIIFRVLVKLSAGFFGPGLFFITLLHSSYFESPTTGAAE